MKYRVYSIRREKLSLAQSAATLKLFPLRMSLPKELECSSYTNLLQALGWWLHQPHNSIILVVSVLIINDNFQDSDFPLLIQTSAVHFTGARLDLTVGEGWKEILFSLLTSFLFFPWQMVVSFPCDLYGLLSGWLYFSTLHCKLHPTIIWQIWSLCHKL